MERVTATTTSIDEWTPTAWRVRVARQQPDYRDAEALERALTELRTLPPLVTSWEVENLKAQLTEVAEGRRFLLQGGDCAESFADCRSEIIAAKLKILLQMSVVLIHGSRKPVTRVGRFAGQYAKPRSLDSETVNGVTLPTYRGDLVNHPAFDATSREPDPQLLLTGYQRAGLTLNFIRSLTEGGFADLHHPENWDLSFMRHSDRELEYHHIVSQISESIQFLEIVSSRRIDQFSRVEFFTSHEALHLAYEEAQTRQVPHRTGWYNLATHFPWVGNRTRGLEEAHLEYVRGIANPIAVKIDPTIGTEELVQLIHVLNPKREAGRLTLIHRLGADAVEQHLPRLIAAAESAGNRVVWCCDPMHANTETVPGGLKTRDFSRILLELERSFDVHQRMGSYLGGVHFELTGDNVTECTGGARGLTADGLGRAYRTQVDPRLNGEQALEMALLIARRMRKS